MSHTARAGADGLDTGTGETSIQVTNATVASIVRAYLGEDPSLGVISILVRVYLSTRKYESIYYS